MVYNLKADDFKIILESFEEENSWGESYFDAYMKNKINALCTIACNCSDSAITKALIYWKSKDYQGLENMLSINIENENFLYSVSNWSHHTIKKLKNNLNKKNIDFIHIHSSILLDTSKKFQYNTWNSLKLHSELIDKNLINITPDYMKNLVYCVKKYTNFKQKYIVNVMFNLFIHMLESSLVDRNTTINLFASFMQNQKTVSKKDEIKL